MFQGAFHVYLLLWMCSCVAWVSLVSFDLWRILPSMINRFSLICVLVEVGALGWCARGQAWTYTARIVRVCVCVCVCMWVCVLPLLSIYYLICRRERKHMNRVRWERDKRNVKRTIATKQTGANAASVRRCFSWLCFGVGASVTPGNPSFVYWCVYTKWTKHEM